MITTETDVRLLFPFAMDSIFKIKGQVYELLDRSQYWDSKITGNPLNTKCVNLMMRVIGLRSAMSSLSAKIMRLFTGLYL